MLSKNDILARSREIFDLFTQDCRNIDEEKFFFKAGEKWSIAENLQHLIIAAKTTTLAYRAPHLLLRWIAGNPNRPSRTYDELVAKYKLKLAQGGKATGRFIPQPLNGKISKAKLIENWEHSTNRYLKAFEKGWKEGELDEFLVKHPLLGRITIRELCYFTIYHTIHHHQIILSRLHP